MADSNVRQERAEAELKSKVLVKRMPGFDLLETMLWKPGESFALLDLHLQRLTRSAEYFGFDLDAGDVPESIVCRLSFLPDEIGGLETSIVLLPVQQCPQVVPRR